MEEHNQQSQPCCLLSCWAKLFHKKPEQRPLVDGQLAQQIFSHSDAVELTDPKESPGEVALQAGKTLWEHFIHGQTPIDLNQALATAKNELTEDEKLPEQEMTYVRLCFSKLHEAALNCSNQESRQEAIDIINKFPKDLRDIFQEKQNSTVERPVIQNIDPIGKIQRRAY